MAQKGNSDSITRDYLDSLLVESRYIDSVLPSVKFTIYGETFDTPITTAALSHLHSVCENGMVEYAKGAKNANVRSNIINAVKSATGLSIDKIQVFEMEG